MLSMHARSRKKSVQKGVSLEGGVIFHRYFCKASAVMQNRLSSASSLVLFPAFLKMMEGLYGRENHSEDFLHSFVNASRDVICRFLIAVTLRGPAAYSLNSCSPDLAVTGSPPRHINKHRSGIRMTDA